MISVAGRYAVREVRKALDQSLHVMLFSDNVSIEDEVALKKTAHKKGLIVMGPDCGTSIINGVPLAFANVVPRGPIGIVGASGTGTQEVTCIIANEGSGISQAIGTGGRDVKDAVGGIAFLDAMQALADDPETKVLVLVSKPPQPGVLKKIYALIRKIQKPVVSLLPRRRRHALHAGTGRPAGRRPCARRRPRARPSTTWPGATKSSRPRPVQIVAKRKKLQGPLSPRALQRRYVLRRSPGRPRRRPPPSLFQRPAGRHPEAQERLEARKAMPSSIWAKTNSPSAARIR